MSLTRDEAWEHLCTWTEGASLRQHARSVEIVMRAAADRYGAGAADVEQWGIAGMLHDADYEKWPDEHPQRIVAWLRERGEDTLAHAISAHYTKWNVPYESPLDRALLACDELTGFIVACCLVRPDGVGSLAPRSVQEEAQGQSAFAAIGRARRGPCRHRAAADRSDRTHRVRHRCVAAACGRASGSADDPPRSVSGF